jgi:hypothetical protein
MRACLDGIFSARSVAAVNGETTSQIQSSAKMDSFVTGY